MEISEQINSAIKYFNEKKYLESQKVFEQLLIRDPLNNNYLTYLGICCINLNQFQNAISYLLKSVKIDKRNFSNLNNLALCYQKISNFENAKKIYLKIIKYNKENIDAYLNLGSMLKNLEHYHDAIKIYNLALRNKILSHKVYTNISSAYLGLNELEESLIFSKRAYEMNNKDHFAIINIASVFIRQRKFNLGFDYLNKALTIGKNESLIYLNFGVAYKNMGEYEKAISFFNKCLNCDSKNYDAYLYKSHIELSFNKFRLGWKNYEYRWAKQKKRLISSVPYWNKNSQLKKILIWGEQALGEQLLFSTILHDLRNYFDEIVLVVDEKLVKIFKDSFPSYKVFTYKDEWISEDFDCQAPIGSLGFLFRNELKDFKKSNTLFIDENEKVSLSDNKKIRCGITWKSINSIESEEKSLSLNNLKPILDLNYKIDFFNIQYSNEAKDLEIFTQNEKIEIKEIRDIDLFNDLYGVSKYLLSFDFVIAISNTTAHLSSSLGIPTYVLLSKNIGKLWYWANTKEDTNNSLWYPRTKIYRQEEQGNWQKPIISLLDHIKETYGI